LPRKASDFKIYYRLGVAPDAGPLGLEPSTYYGIAIGANVAAWGQSWVAVLLGETGKPFFIDPVTYIFAQDPGMILKDDELRQSYGLVVDGYGGMLTSVAGKKPLKPEDFSTSGRLTKAGREFVDSVLLFEQTALSKGESTQRRISDYLEMIGEERETRSLDPEFLVPPYFFAASLDDRWYSTSLSMAKYAASKDLSRDVVPVLCLSTAALRDERAVGQIVDDYGGVSSVNVWLSDFDETKATPSQLQGYGRLISGFAKKGVRPLVLYGGFYALMLSSVGLAGISSGVCYAESKGVARQATGGGAPIRYYVPRAHLKVALANAISFYAANPAEFCRCAVCRALVNSAVGSGTKAKVTHALSNMDRSLAGRHYMRNREREVRDHIGAPKSAWLRSLKSDLRRGEARSSGTFGISTAPLNRWRDALDRL